MHVIVCYWVYWASFYEDNEGSAVDRISFTSRIELWEDDDSDGLLNYLDQPEFDIVFNLGPVPIDIGSWMQVSFLKDASSYDTPLGIL